MTDPNPSVPPLRNPRAPEPGSSDSSAGTTDPLDDLAATLDGGPDEFSDPTRPEPPPAAPIPTEGIRLAVRQAFRMVEAWAVNRYGDAMRATDEERDQIIDAGTFAAIHYAPVLFQHPLTPLAFALGGWIVRGTIAARAASTDAETPPAGTGSTGPLDPETPSDFPAAELDRTGARVERFG
jgi:hypothetical protein